MTRTFLLSLFLGVSTLGAVPNALKFERGTPDEPFEILQRDWTVQSLRAVQREVGVHAWVEGDVLNFLHVSPAESVMLVGSIQGPMKRIDDSDFWVLSVRIPGLSKAVIGYAFLEAKSRSTGDQYVWRGVDAPAAVAESTKLEGKVLKEQLWMDGLEEHRDVSVYLPPGHDAGDEHTVIYMGDGNTVQRYARMIEPLIESGDIPKTMIVGFHNGGYRGERGGPPKMELDYRAIEYLVGADEMIGPELIHQGHFELHERFFTETVREWAEREHGASSDRKKRGIFGVSNGAAFAVTMAHRHADLYGFVLPFSFPWSKAVQEPRWSMEEAPRHYFVAGLLEPHVHKTTKDYAEQLKSAGYQVVFKQRLSGHDALMWREEFVDAVRWALSDKKRYGRKGKGYLFRDRPVTVDSA